MGQYVSTAKVSPETAEAALKRPQAFTLAVSLLCCKTQGVVLGRQVGVLASLGYFL